MRSNLRSCSPCACSNLGALNISFPITVQELQQRYGTRMILDTRQQAIPLRFALANLVRTNYFNRFELQNDIEDYFLRVDLAERQRALSMPMMGDRAI